MYTWSLLPALTNAQRMQLRDFVETILPPEGHRIWNRDNELERVHGIVNRWTKKLFGFHVPPADLYAEFEHCGHLIHRVSMEECPGSILGEMEHKAFSPYVEQGAWRLHMNVHVLSLRLLAASNKPLPANAPVVKRVAQARLTERLAQLEARMNAQRAA